MKARNYLLSTILAGMLVGCGGGSDNSTPTNKDDKKDKDPQQTSVIIKPKTMQDGDFTGVGLTMVEATLANTLEYNSDVEQYVAEHKSEDGGDNYVRGIDVKGDKIAVASVYHNALTVFDTASNSHGFSPFAALDGASHGVNGTSVDGTTSASENWLNEVKFSPNEDFVYLNVKPKYLGRGKTGKNPDAASYGLYKAKLTDKNSVDREASTTIYKNGQFYSFEILNNGDIIAMAKDGKFVKFDKNLKELKSFTVENVKRFDVANDKLFVLVESGEEENKTSFIQEYSLDGAKIGDEIPYNKPIGTKGYTSFELTPDATKAITYVSSKENGEVCSVLLNTKEVKCTKIDVPLYAVVGDISPNGKYIAFTTTASSNKGSIVNIEGKPALVSDFPAGNVGYAIKFASDSKLLVSQNRREIKAYNLAESSTKVTEESKFDKATANIFSANAPDMNNVEVYTRKHDGKDEIRAGVHFPTFVSGANVNYELSNDFKDYINSEGNFIKVPTQPISGTVKATIVMLKDGKVFKQTTKTSPMTIMPKK